MITVAALQLNSIGINPAKLDYYLRICHQKGVSLLLLGEYVLNRFFKELEKTAIGMIREQSNHQIKILCDLSSSYNNITIVVPLVQVLKERPYKTIVRVEGTSVHYYYQQILMGYDHWNEAAFFGNSVGKLKSPMLFDLEGFKIGVLAGFELYFDPFWLELIKKNADLVLLPTVSTFKSHQRWTELIKTRAFLSNLYVLRANRVGEYAGEGAVWKFYGQSLLATPFGEIEMVLGDKEELLIATVSKESIREAKCVWGFGRELKQRGML